jgi:hypothetical protein
MAFIFIMAGVKEITIYDIGKYFKIFSSNV